jgi:hypothetical protein
LLLFKVLPIPTSAAFDTAGDVMSHGLTVSGIFFDCGFHMTCMVAGEDDFDSGILWDDIFSHSGTPAHGTGVIPDCGRAGIIDGQEEVEVRVLVIYCLGDIDFACHAPELSIGALSCEFEDCGQVIGV